MSDVVSRLLAAIDEREAKAREAIEQLSSGNWHQRGPTVETFAGVTVADYAITEAIWHIEANDPDSVLRLCQAHRDIVAKYERTKRLLDEANQRVLQHVMDGTVATRQEQRDFDSLHIEEAVLGEVVEDLAGGYGIEDTP